MRDQLLIPLGMLDTVMGETPRDRRAVREVPYYAELWPWEPGSYSAVATESSPYAPGPFDYAPYADFDVRNYDAHGGWLSSVFDLGLLVAELFANRSSLLTADSRSRLVYPWQCRDWGGTNMTALGLDLSGSSIVKGGQFTGCIARIENLSGGASGPASFTYAFNRNWGDLPNASNSETMMIAAIRLRIAAISAWGGVADDLFIA